MIIAIFVGRILIVPGFLIAGSWQQMVLFQWISGTARGAERLRKLTVVSPEPTVAICVNSYLAAVIWNPREWYSSVVGTSQCFSK